MATNALRAGAATGASSHLSGPWAGVAHLVGAAPGYLIAAGIGLLGGGLVSLWLDRRVDRWWWSVIGIVATIAWWPVDRLGAAVWLVGWGSSVVRRSVRESGSVVEIDRGPVLRWPAAGGGGKREWFTKEGVLLARDERGRALRVPLGGRSGSHTLVLGATGSGKTVTQTWLAVRAIEQGLGAIVIDPKGDRTLEAQLRQAALAANRAFLEWSTDGPSIYNPYARGSDTEIADKALAGERYSEPHYLRQAQRYLGHAVRTLRRAGVPLSLGALVLHMEPGRLERLARGLRGERGASTLEYLAGLSPRAIGELGGTRDRLAALAESDAGVWLEPAPPAMGAADGGLAAPGAGGFDLAQAIAWRAVAYFRLDADRLPLLASMLAGALVADLLSTAAALQSSPVPTIVVIDEFSAVVPEQVARLFGRARSAGLSMVLGTQELSDLRGVARPALAEQVLGNVSAVVAHRQVVPASADLLAGVAGTRGAWAASERTERRFGGERVVGGMRSRVREYAIHPDCIKALRPGQAAVILPGAREPVRVGQVLRAQGVGR